MSLDLDFFLGRRWRWGRSCGLERSRYSHHHRLSMRSAPYLNLKPFRSRANAFFDFELIAGMIDELEMLEQHPQDERRLLQREGTTEARSYAIPEGFVGISRGLSLRVWKETVWLHGACIVTPGTGG